MPIQRRTAPWKSVTGYVPLATLALGTTASTSPTPTYKSFATFTQERTLL